MKDPLDGAVNLLELSKLLVYSTETGVMPKKLG